MYICAACLNSWLDNIDEKSDPTQLFSFDSNIAATVILEGKLESWSNLLVILEVLGKEPSPWLDYLELKEYNINIFITTVEYIFNILWKPEQHP